MQKHENRFATPLSEEVASYSDGRLKSETVEGDAYYLDSKHDINPFARPDSELEFSSIHHSETEGADDQYKSNVRWDKLLGDGVGNGYEDNPFDREAVIETVNRGNRGVEVIESLASVDEIEPLEAYDLLSGHMNEIDSKLEEIGSNRYMVKPEFGNVTTYSKPQPYKLAEGLSTGNRRSTIFDMVMTKELVHVSNESITGSELDEGRLIENRIGFLDDLRSNFGGEKGEIPGIDLKGMLYRLEIGEATPDDIELIDGMREVAAEALNNDEYRESQRKHNASIVRQRSNNPAGYSDHGFHLRNGLRKAIGQVSSIQDKIAKRRLIRNAKAAVN